MEKPVLILSAVEREQKYIKEKSFSKNVIFKTVGIGPIEAAINSALLISDLKPKSVYFLGSAGFYSETYLSIGDVALGHIYHFGDLGQVQNHSYKPEIMNLPIETSTFCLTEKFSFKVKNCSVVTVPSITKNDELSLKIKAFFKAEIEHLEAYSIAKICSDVQIPFFSIFGLSNEVGIHSHEQWLKNQDLALEHASDVLGKIISGD